ncbi:MAG: P1 family peptidase [Conexivisphaerales archaeon]
MSRSKGKDKTTLPQLACVNPTLTAVKGISVGHAMHKSEHTGCTVILLSPASPVAVDARGGYPTTFDTHGIETSKAYVKRDAIFLSGGDVFGLAAASGVQKYLVESGLASDQAGKRLPLVVGATIYDLHGSRVSRVDYASLALDACRKATPEPVKLGRVGVGAGASAGNFAGHEFSTKSGVGSSAAKIAGSITVAALVVVNSMGNIFDFGTGRVVAGAKRNGRPLSFEDFQFEYITGIKREKKKRNTTLAVVATDARLEHEELLKVAQLAHNGLAMTIRPVHTSEDGDTVFAVSTGKLEIRGQRTKYLDLIGYYSSMVVARSIVSIFKKKV